MPVKHSPGCGCCAVGVTCCSLIEVKPLPTRTMVNGVATYSDTEWDTSYVSGISGVDNTIPANTTVTIQVPIGCTDYVVDVEVLDDNGTSVTNSSPGLVVKVGDSLQASNVLRATTENELTGTGSTTSFENPTIFSQYDVKSHDRSVPSFYGNNYAAYRFQEIFHTANMQSGVISYKNPPYRSDAAKALGTTVFSLRPPHDAGGLTVEITLQTGNQDVEIGLIQVHSGHMSCTAINALDDVIVDEYAGTFPPLYTITDPASYIVNNATSTQVATMSGPVLSSGSCLPTACTFDYEVELDYTQWTGNHAWSMKWSDLAGYFNITASTNSFHEDGVAASAAAVTALLSFMSKCVQQNWTHSDRMIDWRAYEWVEPELAASSYDISHSLTIVGGCNVVAASQANIDTDLDAVRDEAVYPSRGPLLSNVNFGGSVCPNPAWCTGDPQLVYKNINYTTSSADRKWCKPIMAESYTSPSLQDVKGFWNLPLSFAYPNAKATASVSADYSFIRGASSSGASSPCNFSRSQNLVDVDLEESATITKIPYYSGTDPNYTLIGGAGVFGGQVLPTRDNHLINLSLYIASETATFTATTGIVMQYSAVNYSTTRPNYSTCGCPCTADELFQDDLFSISTTPTTYWHRWMEFSDGADIWYVKWSAPFPYNTTPWTFFFRRASDCKEITFTGVSNTLPNGSAAVTKTSTNGSGDTLTITVQA